MQIDSNAEQLLSMKLLISTIDSDRVIETILVQEQNAQSPIEVTESGTVTVVILSLQ